VFCPFINAAIEVMQKSTAPLQALRVAVTPNFWFHSGAFCPYTMISRSAAKALRLTTENKINRLFISDL
jgi:hypothetical protein